ncbi:hypothetical protein SAMN04487764_0812 [Gillisia sp. Hel1_33_143]|uniref:hypothetical protein n=1 Tax=Gillisia sp. Hel1_33_143 TaxID=1336796 RepID=UPI0008794F53|nr:hypothetical protein [Gillisia sp. Hel1_33_143]SDR83766.1 hypothetical protein SAMN04487764_0812 [Gillisia sp. Hel1_33_143]
MEERKHIDRLYQEKFKDFEASPRDAVWKNISSKLQEKQFKKRSMPIWYRMAGIAALFALFFSYTAGFFKSNSNATSQVFSKVDDNNSINVSLASEEYTQKMISSTSTLQALIMQTKLRDLQQAALENEIEVNKGAKNKANFTHIIKADEIKDISTGKSYAFNDFEENPSKITLYNVSPKSSNKISSSELKKLSKIASDKDLDLISEEDENSNDLGTMKRLSVSTVAAPIYYDNFGSANTIDEQFASNSGSGEITMSYGINFAYNISEKIKLRSGISKVGMSYNIKDIAFTAAVNPLALSGINYKGDIPNYKIENRSVRPFSNISASTNFEKASLAAPSSGYINQKIGFIEVPLEVEYVIIDKKIGFNIIGGASTLFLDENSISLKTTDFSTPLGESNQLNNISFSTNIGLGVDYEISNQFQLSVEPMFKYQINTYNTSNVNPYYFGVYSGFSFKF